MKSKGTYVYCLIAARRRPSLGAVPKGLPSAGAVRLVDASQSGAEGLKKWLVVADVPLTRFGESAINQRLHDLDWVARAALAHEAVVESFVNVSALVPMRLFTIFTNDARALEHIARDRERLQAILKRVAHHDEWGIRIALDRKRAVAPRAGARRKGRLSGAGYLVGKKAIRDATASLAARSRQIVSDLYEGLARQSSLARRRGARELPLERGPLLLDAAFLVDRSRSRRFRATLAREARRLGDHGYRVSLTGPWPAYSFLE
jgi:hypothetical protein